MSYKPSALQRNDFVKVVLAIAVIAVPVTAAVVFVNRAETRRGDGTTAETFGVPVAPGSYINSDALPATILLDWQRGEQATYAGDPGTVTEVHITAGTVASNGSSLISVNGRVVFAMTSATPLYRDLKQGDQGTDVTVLEQFLAFFKLVQAEGRTKLDRDMAQAIKNFNLYTGRGDLGTTFARSTVVWIGTPGAASAAGPIGTLLVKAGDLLAGPTALYETSATITGAHAEFDVSDQPELVGARIADLDVTPAVQVQLAAKTYTIASSAFAQLTQVGPRPEFGSADHAWTKLTAATRLTVPAEFQVVPAAAVVTSRTGTTCVYSPVGVPTRIGIAGTEPGIVLVATGTDLPEMVLAPAVGIDGCGD